MGTYTPGLIKVILTSLGHVNKRAAFLAGEALESCRDNGTGKPVELIAEMFGVGLSTIFEWQAKYRSGGASELNTKPAPGRPPKLSGQQMKNLYSLMAGRDLRQYDLDFALWTREMVAELIRREFGIQVSLITVSRIQKRLGMSPQRPVYRAYQADPRQVEDWLKRIHPALRTEAVKHKCTGLFCGRGGRAHGLPKQPRILSLPPRDA